jgi:hypothetical protein
VRFQSGGKKERTIPQGNRQDFKWRKHYGVSTLFGLYYIRGNAKEKEKRKRNKKERNM